MLTPGLPAPGVPALSGLRPTRQASFGSTLSKMPRGRFAPSPTGPLHLGNARTALLSWLDARARGGSYVMRVEDLDGPRIRRGLEARILAELRWLGLDWDEGPDVGGPAGPYRQSERAGRYAEALTRLVEAGAAYPCFCSRAEIALASQAPHGPSDEGPRYPGTCRALGPGEAAARAARRRPAHRLRVPEGEVGFEDAVHGPRRHDVAATVGDFVVMRADGVAAYQLAVTLDDAAMEITDVVRGDDLLPSTARQLLVYRALGLAAPRFGHVPLLLGEDTQRLAKRHGARSLGELREGGADPRAVVGLLAASAGLVEPGARVWPSELVAGFRLSALSPEPAVLRAADVEALLR
jgi:glutamyl-tRNA synthetase